MKCANCSFGQVHPDSTTVTLHRNGKTVSIKNVPADVCDSCGEYYLQEDVASRVLTLMDNAASQSGDSAVVAHLGDVLDYEFMQRRLELLEELSPGERAVLGGRTYSQSEAREKMSKWLK